MYNDDWSLTQSTLHLFYHLDLHRLTRISIWMFDSRSDLKTVKTTKVWVTCMSGSWHIDQTSCLIPLLQLKTKGGDPSSLSDRHQTTFFLLLIIQTTRKSNYNSRRKLASSESRYCCTHFNCHHQWYLFLVCLLLLSWEEFHHVKLKRLHCIFPADFLEATQVTHSK